MTARLARLAARYLLVGGLLVLQVGPAVAAQSPPPLPGDASGCLPAPTTTTKETPWAQKSLRLQRVWRVTKGAGITVGVVDTGVDADNPQLAGRVRTGVDVTSDGTKHANDDCLGHGTFVAGIIAAAPAPDTAFAGVAPAATILPIRVATTLQPDKPGSLSPGRLANGIKQAVDDGADVINVSATTTVNDPELAEAVAYAAEQDVVLVVSVANNPDKGASVTYPAAYPSVIAVGAIKRGGALADFSATGDFVDLVAPGAAVVSIGPHGAGQWEGSGTSYAAPFVAGTAALVRAYHPGLTAVQVKHRLEATATHPAAELPDPEFGWGVVNPVAAVTAALPKEHGAAASRVAPPRAALPPSTADDIGPLLAVIGVVGAIVAIFGLGWVARLSGAAHRRRWRRPRSATPADHLPEQ